MPDGGNLAALLLKFREDDISAYQRIVGTIRLIAPLRDDILRSLQEDGNFDVFFTTMIDLYAIHPNFPGLEESESLRENPIQRVQFLEQRFATARIIQQLLNK